MRYFKIPLKKLVKKLPNPIEPEKIIQFNTSQLGMISGLEKNRFWVHISARRTGKSYAAAILALGKLLEPRQYVTVVAPNYNLSSIIWDFVTGFITQLKLETDRFNQKDKIVQLINGSVFRLLSANNRDSLVGRAANLLIVDEAAIIPDDEYFTRDLRPSLSTYDDSRALFITTPRGKANYMYKYYMRGNSLEYPEWGSAVYDWTSNPYLTQEDIDEAKRSVSKNFFRQEYYCEWTVFEGQIYNINQDKHLKNLSKDVILGSRYNFIAGLDIGYRDDTAFVVIATDGECYFIVDNYVAKKAITSVHAKKIKELIDRWNIDNIYIDPAAAQARADLAYEHDIYCDKAIKSINDGINHIQNIVEKNNLLFDEKNALATFNAMVSYRWNTKTETQKPVHDEHSHLSDAVRYAIYSHHKSTVGIFTG